MQISASGGLSSADFSTWRAKMDQAAFKGLDSDANGSVSQAEFQAAMQNLPAGPPGPATPAAPGATSTDGQGAADAITNAFKAIDSNGDGQVSSSELSSALAAHGRHHHRHPTEGDGDPASGAGQGGAPGSIQSALASTFAAQLLGQGQAVAGSAAGGAESGQASATTTASNRARHGGGFDLLGFLQEQFLGGDAAPRAANAGGAAGSAAGTADSSTSLGAAEQARQMLMRYAVTQYAARDQPGMRLLA